MRVSVCLLYPLCVVCVFFVVLCVLCYLCVLSAADEQHFVDGTAGITSLFCLFYLGLPYPGLARAFRAFEPIFS